MLILEPGESGLPLPREDRRWQHLHRILKVGAGDRLRAGCTDGTVGTALVQRLDESSLVLDYSVEAQAAALAPVTLILGFPRPIQAARIFRELCSLGLARILVVGSDLGEKSYLSSHFYTGEEYRRSLLEGAEQAANPRLPEVRRFWTLDRCLAEPATLESGASRLCLHPLAGAPNLGGLSLDTTVPVILAVGSERGWTERECELLAGAGFLTVSLGSRILKTETAAEAAVVLALAKLGRL